MPPKWSFIFISLLGSILVQTISKFHRPNGTTVYQKQTSIKECVPKISQQEEVTQRCYCLKKGCFSTFTDRTPTGKGMDFLFCSQVVAALTRVAQPGTQFPQSPCLVPWVTGGQKSPLTAPCLPLPPVFCAFCHSCQWSFQKQESCFLWPLGEYQCI